MSILNNSIMDRELECPICAEAFNKSNFKSVSCNYCEFQACKSCCIRFIEGLIEDPSCMNCKKTWSMDFLIDRLGKTYINTKYKTHRENLLCEREKGLMPTTQSYVERIIESKKIEEEMKALSLRRLQLTNELAQVKEDLGTLSFQKHTLLHNPVDIQGAVSEKRQFVRQCPVDDCRGFLSTQWKCGICATWVCPDCHEIKGLTRDVEHTCKVENIETAKLIAKESKSCPGCSVPICKISGCSQMYCTNCHTPWNWNTGQIVSGPIHNPHYYDLQRQNGQVIREHGDVPCGGFPDAYQFNKALSSLVPKDDMHILNGKLRMLTHMWFQEAPRYRCNTVLDNVDLRVKYMLKEIDENKFKSLLQKKEKANRKKRDYYAVLSTLRDVGQDLMNQIMRSKTIKSVFALVQDFDKIWAEADMNLEIIANKYNCTKPILLEQY